MISGGLKQIVSPTGRTMTMMLSREDALEISELLPIAPVLLRMATGAN